ncbi:hypothetical protein [Gandjariella thermophila]|uniref:Uncharacterized protein n=1 Tax=Gandjariella thermophila TaxID=1931992 RepID=A0A4D4J309_9PSEU|nr:hypothetical protein [Gandjariella thermophila]GDY29824.1 hypothetical protein GTS_14570 [Gandjariella thermophila]
MENTIINLAAQETELLPSRVALSKVDIDDFDFRPDIDQDIDQDNDAHIDADDSTVHNTQLNIASQTANSNIKF